MLIILRIRVPHCILIPYAHKTEYTELEPVEYYIEEV
jgi:hypothetical protein